MRKCNKGTNRAQKQESEIERIGHPRISELIDWHTMKERQYRVRGYLSAKRALYLQLMKVMIGNSTGGWRAPKIDSGVRKGVEGSIYIRVIWRKLRGMERHIRVPAANGSTYRGRMGDYRRYYDVALRGDRVLE